MTNPTHHERDPEFLTLDAIRSELSRREFPAEFSFCPHCSAELQEALLHEATRRACGQCGWIQYLNPTVGAAVVVVRDGAILLGQRRSGRWCIPCGHVEWNESIEEAARREFEEETGLQAELQCVLAVKSNFHRPDRQTVGIWYLGRITAGRLRPGGDLQEVAYFRWDELPELEFPTDCELIDELRHR